MRIKLCYPVVALLVCLGSAESPSARLFALQPFGAGHSIRYVGMRIVPAVPFDADGTPIALASPAPEIARGGLKRAFKD